MAKTPLSALHEYCMRKKVIPQYHLVSINEGKGYECLLYFDNEFTDIMVKCEGKTKKEAKHNAANEALKLILSSIENINYGNGDNNFIDLDLIRSPYDYVVKGNFIGKLKEICISNLLPLPEYTLININTTRNCHRFNNDPYITDFDLLKRPYMYIKCNVASLIQVSRCCNKKEGKHISAQSMIEKIKSVLKDKYIEPIKEDLKNKENILKSIDKEIVKKDIDSNLVEENDDEVKKYNKLNYDKCKQETFVEGFNNLSKNTKVIDKISVDNDKFMGNKEESANNECYKIEEYVYKNCEAQRKILKINFRINIGDYYNVKQDEEFFTLIFALNETKLLENMSETEIKNLLKPKELFQGICNLSGFEFSFLHHKNINFNLNKKFYVTLEIKTSPPWVSIGNGITEEEAENKAAIKMLCNLKFLLN